MKLKDIENKKMEIEKEVEIKEKEMDVLNVEIATLEAQAKSKNRKMMDLAESISLKKDELRKLEIAKEVLLTPAQLDSTEDETEQPKKYDSFKPEYSYTKGERFKEGNRLYEVVYNHTSDKKFNKLATNKYQLTDEDTLKPILNYSILKTYNKFEKCLSDDIIYSSKIDENKYSPKVRPDLWFKIG